MRPGDRVRSTSDGQLGTLVEQDGQLGVRLDRRGETRVLPYREHQWAPDVVPRITEMAVARICWGADREWRQAHGEPYSIPEWIGVKEQDRIAWMRNGPPLSNPARRRFWEQVRKAASE